MARVQVNTDIGQAPALRTTARPLGTVARPAAHNPSGAMAVMESLAALRPQLNAHLSEAKAEYAEKEQTRAYDTIQGMTFEQASEMVNSGKMRKTESPWFRAAFQKQYGLSYAANRKRQMLTDYNQTFDKENGNVDEWLSQYVQDDMVAHGGNEFIMSGIREGMGGVLENIRNTQAEYRDTTLTQRAGDQFFTIAGDAVTQAVDAGGDAGAAYTNLYSQHQASLGMTPEALDRQSLALVKRLAEEGNVQAVEAILNADPAGHGSLISRGTTALDAQSLLDDAKTKRGELNRVQNTSVRVDLEERARSGSLDTTDEATLLTLQDNKQITQDQRESLLLANRNALETRRAGASEGVIKSELMDAATEMITTGRGWAVTDANVTNPHTGKPIEMSRKELTEAVVTEQVEAMLGKQATPQVIAARMAEWGIDATYGPWEQAMSSGYIALSSPLIRNSEGAVEIPEAAQTGFALWKGMKDQPHLRSRHVKDATASAIYADAEILEATGTMTADQALVAAARIDRKNTRLNLATAVDRETYNNAVRKVTSSGWFGGAPLNAGDMAGALEGHVRILMDLGLPMSVAVENAAKAHKASHTMVNGVMVNTRDHFIPPKFEENVQHWLETNAARYDEDPADLRLIPTNQQDYWVLVDTSGYPVGDAAPIHISALQVNPNAPSKDKANEEIARRNK